MTPSRRSTLIAFPTPPRRRLKSSAFFGVRNRVQHRLGQRLLHPDYSSPMPSCLCFPFASPSSREQAILSTKKGAYLLKCGRRGKPKFCPFRLSTICKDKEPADSWILGFESHNIKVSPS